ncbi:MAG: RNA polymerase sigma factor [Pseudomonadales bacterium]|nr:RNA polymerase sigma factor [Candidatus Woesebacteria bacterium]MCB9801430.1 RNA polymerase sigma factor [Pseudomonadales bacterium]
MNKMQEAKEQFLILRLQRGEENAVTEWFSLFHDSLFTVAIQKVSSSEDAEEIVQETFLNCMRQIGLFRGKSSIWTWMNAVLRHEIADYYRKKYAKKALRTLPLIDSETLSQVQSASDISDKVSRVLRKMKVEYSELLQQKYIDKKKVLEIAMRFGRSAKSIESDLFRARNEFKYLWTLEEEE